MKTFKFPVSLLFFIALATMTLQAQPGGGGSSGGGNSGGSSSSQGSSNYQSNNNTRQTTSVLDDVDLDSEDEEVAGKAASTDYVGMAGLFEIDLAVVIKKCGIKDKDLIDSVSAVMLEYQNLSARIEKEFSKDVALLRKFEVDAKAGSAPSSSVVAETTLTIKKRSVLVHKRLSDSMSKVLSEKELKKWKSLYNKICESKSFSAEVAK